MKLKRAIVFFNFTLASLFLNVKAKAQAATYENARFLQLGVNYIQPSRTGLENYLKVFSDSLGFVKPFHIDKGYGLTIGFISHHNAFEFSAGGDLLVSNNFEKTGDTTSGKIKTTDINLNFGVNILPLRWFYIGGAFSICNSSGKFIAGTNIDDHLLETPDVSFKSIFNGYSIGIKGEAGFNFNVSPKGDYNTFLRLSGFYEFGLTQYDFYKSFEKRLKNYEGNKKTKAAYPGVTLALLFG